MGRNSSARAVDFAGLFSVALYVVLGCFFYIEYRSNCEEFRPPSPDFEVTSVEVFEM
jgi:hypothetical protein